MLVDKPLFVVFTKSANELIPSISCIKSILVYVILVYHLLHDFRLLGLREGASVPEDGKYPTSAREVPFESNRR